MLCVVANVRPAPIQTICLPIPAEQNFRINAACIFIVNSFQMICKNPCANTVKAYLYSFRAGIHFSLCVCQDIYQQKKKKSYVTLPHHSGYVSHKTFIGFIGLDCHYTENKCFVKTLNFCICFFLFATCCKTNFNNMNYKLEKIKKICYFIDKH